MLWLPEDDTDYVAQPGQPEPLAEESIQQIDGPASRLSTVAEEPSEMTEDTMFTHDEPNREMAGLEATRGCVLCAADGQDIAASPDDESV